MFKKYLVKDTTNGNLQFQDLLTFTLMFFSPVFIYFFDGSIMYLGKFTSTIWHNSTTIFVFPFCLLLFIESLKYLKKPGEYSALKLLGISILIFLSKPSFLFSFIIVFPIICFYKFGWLKRSSLVRGCFCSDISAASTTRASFAVYGPATSNVYSPLAIKPANSSLCEPSA